MVRQSADERELTSSGDIPRRLIRRHLFNILPTAAMLIIASSNGGGRISAAPSRSRSPVVQSSGSLAASPSTGFNDIFFLPKLDTATRDPCSQKVDDGLLLTVSSDRLFIPLCGVWGSRRRRWGKVYHTVRAKPV